MSDKSSQLDRLKTELDENTVELNNLKSENCRLEEQLNASNQLVKNLEEGQQMSAVLLNEQKASITATNEEKLQLEKVVCEYKEKTELLSAENEELEKSLHILDAQHQDAVQQLIALCNDNATNNQTSDKIGELNTNSNMIDKPGPVEASSSDSSSLPSEMARASALDAANLIEEEERAQLECNRVLNRAETKQSSDTDGELKACREELQQLHLMMMEREKSYNDHISQLSAELESCVSAKNAKCSECSSKDRLIEELNAKTKSLEDQQQQLVGDFESRRGEFEDENRICKVEISQLRQQVEELTTKLRLADEQLATYPVADSRADEVIATLRAEIESLKESIEEKKSVCQLYETEVERLTGVEDRLTKEVERQQEVISKLPQTVVSSPSTDIIGEMSMLRDHLSARERESKEMTEENSRLRQQVAELKQLRQKHLEASNGSACPSSNHDVYNGNQTSDIESTTVKNSVEISNSEPQNDDTCHQSNSCVPSDPKEISQLCSTISQQKDMLDALNSKYASLRGLLEDRSQAQHGSSVLSDVHQLEMELRDVRTDRERLLTVLGEKTREASALRAEVHRLTSVAAASQAALIKAQRDAQQIASQSQQATNQDMKNEAVKKLSQMIKDKDMEIDALQLKNATLVQV